MHKPYIVLIIRALGGPMSNLLARIAFRLRLKLSNVLETLVPGLPIWTPEA